jgi:hypothetical protein
MFPDFKLHNLVLVEPAEGRPYFVVLDLVEAVPRRPRYPERLFLRRFAARLPGFSRLDMVRLARAYLAVRSDPRSWQDLCREVQPLL